jgi:hypothetical protein
MNSWALKQNSPLHALAIGGLGVGEVPNKVTWDTLIASYTRYFFAQAINMGAKEFIKRTTL